MKKPIDMRKKIMQELINNYGYDVDDIMGLTLDVKEAERIIKNISKRTHLSLYNQQYGILCWLSGWD